MPMEIDVRATNEDPLEIIKRGVNVWNRWRAENPDVRTDLEGADLSHFQLEQVNLKDVNLKHCNFTAAVLEGANLSGSDLSGAILEAAYLPTAILRQTKLSNTDLTGSVLSGATLHGANLNSANLSGANLSHADLSGAVFISTNLTGAVFSNALLASTVFEDIDFAEVKDLESAQHLRPSIIGLRTVYRDKVPNSFLRNAGVPDDFIIFLELWDQPKVEPNTILLTEKKLTPAFLSTTLNPFLSAIANLQYTISLIQGRPKARSFSQVDKPKFPYKHQFGWCLIGHSAITRDDFTVATKTCGKNGSFSRTREASGDWRKKRRDIGETCTRSKRQSGNRDHNCRGCKTA